MPSERGREIDCPACRGDWRLCRFSTCPKLESVRGWLRDHQVRQSTSLYGATPPAAFVGEWGYPAVLAGPLVPPGDQDVTLMDSEERWLDLSLPDVLRLRLSMVRGKRRVRIDRIWQPPRQLEAVQEVAMASHPVHAEMLLLKRPSLEVYFSPRGPPVGPSAPFEALRVVENPRVPRRVDYIVSDTDMLAEEASWDLYTHRIQQRHITRILSLGLLGQARRRRLVPTEWSITAIDDILARRLKLQVMDYSELAEYRLFGQTGAANNVQVLFLPGPWMFEALEAWEGHPSEPASDHELAWGRRGYPTNLLGAYHASRLPVLEYLDSIRRQATAIVFLEVYRDWIPLGVWRFRELARRALRSSGQSFSTLEEALNVLQGRLHIPLQRWLAKSKLYTFHREQRRLEDFLR